MVVVATQTIASGLVIRWFDREEYPRTEVAYATQRRWAVFGGGFDLETQVHEVALRLSHGVIDFSDVLTHRDVIGRHELVPIRGAEEL